MQSECKVLHRLFPVFATTQLMLALQYGTCQCFLVIVTRGDCERTAKLLFLPPIRNTMPDFGSEVMAEALAQRALVKPVYTIPVIPLSSSNQYRHQDHLDMKDYKKVSVCCSPAQWNQRNDCC